ncbi:hypothetical protein GUITHDRAFT_166167 [Guillardia theta CCMP2712]|uniref:Uncharacterized protein n=1 Tax=Guillardia theta (strain CCMP2712) TaxID=905079 RepID=L1IEB6_GUITC|nr:hypothetical protein GUITHDRAFT_166167 [Guillardia theta CCMP2712]EKX34573.1 hypothetical protein GUITHDRAFT_166167 [Guillardia theta CCMP2712]|mmetsp:Transcript_6932/g.24279  ORF Transcript_6932/g.24279 Transcript_6932/m.24279 type:complete len:165 (-) Transcript_6932:119-613(-)|eukprot:XP_005821553.1 hypothetical protein GUITHDRAFT_166167 [Guillardia theta CCMP2712]
MLRSALLLVAAAAASAFAPSSVPARGLQLKSSSFCPAAPMQAARPANKAALRMGLEDITDTSSLGTLKWFGFFGASFVPSFFLAGYFLGGIYPGMIADPNTPEPSWWPTAMQYSHGVNKGTLATNVAKVQAKEAELKAAKEKAAAAKKAAKAAAKAAKEAAKAQ